MYVWDTETHERLGVLRAMEWLNDSDIPLDRSLTLSSVAEGCDCPSRSRHREAPNAAVRSVRSSVPAAPS